MSIAKAGRGEGVWCSGKLQIFFLPLCGISDTWGSAILCERPQFIPALGMGQCVPSAAQKYSGLNQAGGWLAVVLAVVRNSGLDGDLSRNLAFCFVDIFFFLFLYSWCGTSTQGAVDCYRKALPG